jgi:hypothetical protein
MKKVIAIAAGILILPCMAFAATKTPAAPASATETKDKAPPVSCDYEKPAKPSYKGQFIAVRKKGAFAKGEVFETKVYIQNVGNTPWFSADSGCNNPIANLGTEKSRDRNSIFFTDSLFWESNWAGANRIKMETPRVDPQGLATFTFWSKAPDNDGLYREYFDVVIEGQTWLAGGLFSTDIKVGEPGIDPEKRDLLRYMEESMNLATVDLSGDKNIEVDISEQKMWLKIGDYVIREFRVSTGTNSHPTPVGTTKILEKRPVRVAASSPHYIMPLWMMYRKGGYGIHALPSLANDRGVYWHEALAHIGTRRSHGCIRLLPNDAQFAYDFGEVGMKVVVHY